MRKRIRPPTPILTDDVQHRPNYYRAFVKVRLPDQYDDRRAKTVATLECQAITYLNFAIDALDN